MTLDDMTVEEAARLLGVTPQRIRALISRGDLEAEKIAGRWFVSPSSIQRHRNRSGGGGRPLSSDNAWALLRALSGQTPKWLSPWDKSRLHKRLNIDPNHLVAAVRRRADQRNFYAHPGLLKRLADDNRLILGGVSAARHYKLDLRAGDDVEAYIRDRDLKDVIKTYKLSSSRRPNVTLRVVKPEWPLNDVDHFAPAAAVAADLVESDDARSQRAGRSLLKRSRRESQ